MERQRQGLKERILTRRIDAAQANCDAVYAEGVRIAQEKTLFDLRTHYKEMSRGFGRNNER